MVFSTMFRQSTKDGDRTRTRDIHREWDRQRARAISPAERDEIDAIFARHL